MNIYLNIKIERVMITGEIENTMLSLFKVFVPPGSDWTFYKYTFEIMTTQSEGIFICGRDLKYSTKFINGLFEGKD